MIYWKNKSVDYENNDVAEKSQHTVTWANKQKTREFRNTCTNTPRRTSFFKDIKTDGPPVLAKHEVFTRVSVKPESCSVKTKTLKSWTFQRRLANGHWIGFVWSNSISIFKNEPFMHLSTLMRSSHSFMHETATELMCQKIHHWWRPCYVKNQISWPWRGIVLSMYFQGQEWGFFLLTEIKPVMYDSFCLVSFLVWTKNIGQHIVIKFYLLLLLSYR